MAEKKQLKDLEPVKQKRRVDVRVSSFMFRGEVKQAKYDEIKKVYYYELENDHDEFAKHVLRKAK